jgi:hypothetical protein
VHCAGAERKEAEQQSDKRMKWRQFKPRSASNSSLDVAVRKGKAQVPPYRQQDDLRLELTPFE